MDESARLTYWQSAACAAVSGATALTLTAPLEVVRIVAQVSPQYVMQQRQAQGGRSMFAVTRSLYAQGLTSFWRGNGASILRWLPFNKTQAVAYSEMRILWGDPQTQAMTYGRAFGAATLASVIATIAVQPFDVVKTRLTIRNSPDASYRGVINCGMHIFRTEGLEALYRGTLPATLGVLPFTIVTFMCYELLGYVAHVRGWDDEKLDGPNVGFWISCVSLGAGQLASYPFDTIKRIMQAEVAPRAAPAAPTSVAVSSAASATNAIVAPFQSMSRCFGTTITTRGIRGLWRGGLVATLKVVPFAIIMQTTYQFMLQQFDEGDLL